MPRALDGRLAPEAEPGRGALPGKTPPPHRSMWACTTREQRLVCFTGLGLKATQRAEASPWQGEGTELSPQGDTRELPPARVPPKGDEHADNV